MAVPLPDSALIAPGGAPLLPSLVSERRIRAQRFWRALRLWLPAGFVIVMLAMCFLLPLVVSLPSATNGNILNAGEPPFSAGHWLGTDAVGNDIFSQIVHGGQVAFEVGFSSTIIGVAIGSVLGVTAGYFGGLVDAAFSYVLDVLIAFPGLVLALAIAEGLGPSEIHIIWALTVFSIPGFGRITRASTLQLRALPFMTAARLAGTRRWRILARHVLPNVLPPLVSLALLNIGLLMIVEGALDYLGYGIPPPAASWGAMIANGQNVLTAQPQYVLIPTLFLFATVVALNMLGDALRERWAAQ